MCFVMPSVKMTCERIGGTAPFWDRYPYGREALPSILSVTDKEASSHRRIGRYLGSQIRLGKAFVHTKRQTRKAGQT